MASSFSIKSSMIFLKNQPHFLELESLSPAFLVHSTHALYPDNEQINEYLSQLKQKTIKKQPQKNQH